MTKSIRDNLARFFYDTAKLSTGVLVLGAVAKHPFPIFEFMVGVILTLTFVGVGISIETLPAMEA